MRHLGRGLFEYARFTARAGKIRVQDSEQSDHFWLILEDAITAGRGELTQTVRVLLTRKQAGKLARALMLTQENHGRITRTRIDRTTVPDSNP